MANNTRSGRNSKSDEAKSSKGTISNGKGSTQDSGLMNSNILRRSSRETPSKDKIIPCPSSIRRSERLEKQVPATPPVKKKPERVEKQTTPSSLRRSLRGKNQSDESPVSDRITKKKNGTVEAEESRKIEKQDSKLVRVKKMKMTARTYEQMFIQQNKRVDAAEKMQDSVSKERTADNSDLLGGGNDIQLERKRNLSNIDVGTLKIAANKENCTSTAESSEQLCESKHFVERCVTCSKKQRLDIDWPNQKRCCSCDKSLDQEICHTSDLKGRSEADVAATTSAECCNTNLQQMGPPQDIQSNIDRKSCVVCKLGGKLLCCDGKGCNRSYHASCLNLPLEYDRPGYWLCLLCIKKKIESGAQSVSEGIESLWESREVVVSDFAGSLKQKQYFVKYKGLAHVHNQWIAESQVLLEAPSLVTEFTGKKQVAEWKLEWTMPQCLLKKRLVDSHCEWLVKWRGLEYEHATWELANSSILNSPEAASLIKKYENRHEKANKASLLSNVDKDSATEYINMLSLLQTSGDNNSAGSRMGDTDNISALKDSLSRHITYECKSDSTRFSEYWVPVQISDVQLEQYCEILLSNYTSLRSCTKNDHMGAIREILNSVRKCCNHPFLVDSFLKDLMVEDLPAVEYLDVGIKASGKLQLLEKMLVEMKSRGLRVLILFHAIDGYGRDSTVGYLDDFLRQRFGSQSYERMVGGGLPSKNKAALKRFKEESERFVFLLESRACLPSIKLSSVDCIVIFDSDWNPMNDLRALQKITIESKSEPIKVFRLYSSCTVEEKVLIFAKQGVTLLDSTLSNINCSNSHILLMWGTRHLFNKCDKFHEVNNSTDFSRAKISSDQSLLKDVIQEFKMILSQDTEIKKGSRSSTILKVQHNGGVYGGNVLLLDELKVQSMGEEVPHNFWFDLLEGRHPQWKYLSDSSQRNRKRVKYNDNLSKNTEIASIEVVKKCKKVISKNTDFTSTTPELEEGKVLVRDRKGNLANASQTSPRSFACAKDSFHATQSTYPLGRNGITPEAEDPLGETGEIMKKLDAQKNLHLLLKPKIYKLCEILKFKEDVKDMVGRLLEYVMHNHHVQAGSTTILQAFQLSLCWIATSLLKHNIDWKDSLAVAKQHLEFGCRPEDVHCVYSMLLKKLKSIGSPFKDLMGDPECSRISHFNVNLEVEGSPLTQECPMGLPSETRMTENTKLKVIKHTEKIYRKHMLRFDKKQNEEVEELERKYDEEKAQLEKEYQVERVVVRSIHSHHPSIIDRMKKLKETFEVKLKEHSLEMEIRRQNLKKRHVTEKNIGVKACLLEEVNSLPRVEALGNGPENVVSTYSHPSEEQSIEGDVPNMPDTTSLHSGKRIFVLALNKSESKKIDETNTLSLEKVAYTQPDGMESPGSLEKEIPDRDMVLEDEEISPDMPEAAHDEVLEGSQFNREQDGSSLVNSPSLPPAEGLREVLQLQDECFQLSTTPGISNDDAPANEVDVVSSDNPIGSPLLLETLRCTNSTLADQSVTQVEIPFSCHATTVQSNQEVPPEDAVENLPNSPSECASTLGHTAIEGHDLVPLIHSQLSPSIELASFSHNQLDLPPSTSGMEYLRSTQDHVYTQNAQTTNAMVDNITRSLNQTSMQAAGTPLLHARTVVSDFSNRSIQTTSTASVMASRMTHHTYFDPLQNELERILRETEQTMKIHEEAKLRLQSDREKEIEEAIAQIRRKYESLAQDKEQQFQIKKQALDSYFKKVYMNKMLAEAFRSKCMDLRVPGKQGLTQNQSQVSLPRSHIVSNPSTVGTPVARPRIVTSPAPRHPLSSPSSVGLPARPSYVSLPLSIGPLASPIPPAPAPAPHVQIVHNSASLFSNSPNRHPFHINTINPPLRNFQVGSGIRAPAPHLQPFRPSMPSNSSLPSITPLAPNSSSPFPQHSARPNLHSPSSANGHKKPWGPESGTSLRDHLNTMLGDNNENRSSGPIIPNFLSLPEVDSNFDPLDFIEFGTLAGTQVDSSTVDVSSNVVCLSDDEC